MEIKITKIVILTHTAGLDDVSIFTDKPSPYPKVTDENLMIHFGVENGKGIEYVKKNFVEKDITIEEINIKTGERRRI